jgi:hypothetical protein
MSKTEKNNRGKVPKITEAEYTAYVNRLRDLSEREEENVAVKMQTEENMERIK